MSSIREKFERARVNSEMSPERLRQRREDRNTLIFVFLSMLIPFSYTVWLALVQPSKYHAVLTGLILPGHILY